jgi:hypothetical protein
MIAINAFDPATLFILAALNPAVIWIAFAMGRRADQWQKIPVAALAASIAGVALYWLGGQIGLFAIHAIGGEAAIFMLQCLFALAWAALGYRMFHVSRP